MGDLIPPEALGAAVPVVRKALEGLAPTIRQSAGAFAKGFIDKTIASLQIGFTPYLENSYNRCRSVKTLLSQDRPLALLDVYVHLSLTCGADRVEDDELIEKLSTYQRVVITGLAGSGKSMFMKYLTICQFENPRGKIPLFVELRQLNSLTSKTLLAFIYQACASAGNRVSYDQFELALRANSLLLILDGFDEIDYTHRDIISQQIIEISQKYPDTTIILSSRPDDKFASWQNFYTFKVSALTKPQVLELIDKINYDRGLKARFKREVDNHLYSSHTSFLSSPLLSSIMLLTYEQFAEIPNKMHIFYEQAFAALFRRHDAQKSQFIRKTYANLAIDDFKGFFAAFCTFSYLEERFSFLDEELKQLTAKALRYVGLKAKIDDVHRDLYECLCMLQRDGIHTAFVHRSFQEFFCAVFMSNYHGPQLRPMLDKFARRLGDEVIPMLFEMARDKLDREWTIPHIQRIIMSVGDVIDDEVSAKIHKRVISSVRLGFSRDRYGVIGASLYDVEGGEDYAICELIFSLYVRTQRGAGLKQRGADLFEHFVLVDLERGVERLLRADLNTKNSTNEDVRRIAATYGEIKHEMNYKDRKAWVVEVRLTPELAGKLKLAPRIREFDQTLRSVKAAIERRIGGQDSMVEFLCSEGQQPLLRRARRRNAASGSELSS